jgi:uncharacterized membrane protein YjgN (DUF898 family)
MAEATIDRFAKTASRTSAGATPLMAHKAKPAAPSDRAAQDLIGPQRFEFTGTGSEYFRIWVVNLLLTIATLGAYSAWAKVRRLQYFYRNTCVGGAVFDYHGDPKAILKGRLLALVLVAAYKISYDVSPAAAAFIAVILVCIMPWLLARAFRFSLANTSHRGLRFQFRGTVAGAYRMLILFPITLAVVGFFVWKLVTSYSQSPGVGVILLVVTLPLAAVGGAVPLAHYFLKRYQQENTEFGQARFFFHARPVEFFQFYGKAIGFFFLGSIPAGIFGFITAKVYEFLLATVFGWVFALFYGLLSAYAFYLFVRPYLESRIQNVVWNHTELGAHRFESEVSARKLLWIHASSLILITLTFGLYKPFAAVRLAKYRVESMTLIPADNLEQFWGDNTIAAAGALGQETTDLFNIDISL